MNEIAPHVYVATEYALVTIGAVLTADGWVCIDTPPYPRDTQAWRTALQEISPLPVQYVINTDHHRDRILGNAWFDGIVIAHTHSAEAMNGLRNVFVSQAAEDLSANDNELVEIASIKTIPPQVAFSDSMRLYCGRREFLLTHKAGSSGGNIWVTLPEDKVIFAGDLVVYDQHPVITESASKAWLTSLWNLRQDRYADWTIVPGRGPLRPVTETEQLSDYLRVARRRVTSILRAGRPRSEIAALTQEFLEVFPYDNDHKDEITRRVKTSLEAIYEELRNSQDGDAEV